MRVVAIFLAISVILLTSSFKPVPAQTKISIVIDPGHGGSDPGHLSENSNHLPEKAINLLIAKKVGAYVEKYLNNVQVVYTRTDDTFPSLDERVAKANSNGADYFVSVHCNANARKTVSGTESHVHTFKSKHSVNLAKEFEKEFSTRAGRKSRGVKDGNDRNHSIQVLKYTKMTSVLVECGFLTNEKEASFLNTDYGQDILASAIFRAIRTQLQANHPTISFVKSTTEGTEDKKGEGAYHIQLMSSKEPMDTEGEAFKKTGLKVTRTKLETTNAYKYRYTSGPYTEKSTAEKDLEKAKKNGFKDAYIIKI